MTSACGQSTFVSAPYSGQIVFNGEYTGIADWLSIGQTDDGFEIEQNHSIQEITTDRWGDSVVNGIYRGGNVFVNTTMLEFDGTGARRLKQAYVDTPITTDPDNEWLTEGKIGTVGCTVLPSYTFSLKMTRTVMLPQSNSSNQPYQYYFPACIVDPNFPVRYNLNSRLRVLPMRFRVLPFDVSSDGSGDWRWFYTRENDVPDNPHAGG